MKGSLDWVLIDQEFNSRMAALDAVLARHLGRPPAVADPLDAEYVMMGLWLPSAGLGAMNVRQEREKLAKVQKLARELRMAWRAMHPDVAGQMELASEYICEAGGLSSASPLSLRIVKVLDELIGKTIPAADEVLDTAAAEGRRCLVNVGIVEALREVWAERKGSSAPKSMTEAGPFADFIIESFESLGLEGNPRAAVDSWRGFRATHPATP